MNLTRTIGVFCAITLAALATAQPTAPDPIRDSIAACFAPARIDAQLAWETKLNAAASPEKLRAWHDALASEPHISGTEGDYKVIDTIAGGFREMGLEVEVQWIWPYLSWPEEARLELVAPIAKPLTTIEPALAGDPFSQSSRLLHMGWNAYSGSGDITAPVVYANFGTKEDFEKLKSLGIDCAGKIVIARYGGNYRGFKAKFAEEAGAIGLVIYTDPGDSGYAKGLMYPEGGWSTAQQIQRGSLLTLDDKRTGDPLTPGYPATEQAERLNPESLAFPKIPVQPVGWDAAQEILQRMKGAPVPEGWQGGLPFTYRLTGDTGGASDGPRVRLMVKQKREITRTANVVGTLRGAKFPDEKIIIGCHHDAWGFGAADPTCGTILVMEAARCFAELAKQGARPDRSIVFAAWGAEEHGIIGSTEWVEAHRADLEANAISYMNLDMATMGPKFGASAAPVLRRLIVNAARSVPQSGDPTKTVYDDWLSRAGKDATEPKVGELGGGSDHVPFYSWLGVPSMSVGSGGARGTSYHSIYDNLQWYRMVVTDDYQPAVMLTRVINIVTARQANADVLPLDVGGMVRAMAAHAKSLPVSKTEWPELSRARDSFLESMQRAEQTWVEIGSLQREAMTSGQASREVRLRVINKGLIDTARLAATAEGVTWHRNWWAVPDPDSGYSVVVWPALQEAIDRRADRAAANELAARRVFELILNTLKNYTPR